MGSFVVKNVKIVIFRLKLFFKRFLTRFTFDLYDVAKNQNKTCIESCRKGDFYEIVKNFSIFPRVFINTLKIN